ncbi:response regulator [Desulfobacterales bacterium HSG17]|nr:response regulator [Desulfobacterales bacterium HSG17]
MEKNTKSENINELVIGKQILVVEDDEGLNKLIQKSLRRAGFSCQGVLTGIDAIVIAKQDTDLILLVDQRLPDMDGTALISKLKSEGCKVPFVAMTGHGDEKIAVEMMKLGARDYLVKGVDLTDILPRVFTRLLKELATEEKLNNAEKIIRDNQALYKSLLESTKAIAYEIDLDSLTFTYISPQIFEITGYPAKVWKNFDFWANTLHPDDKDYCVNYCMKETQRGKDHEFEYRMIKADKQVLWFKDLVSLVKKDGKPIALRGFLIDITEQKRMETQLQQSQKMESIGTLAGGIAHDFNNILFPVLGHTEMLIEDVPEDSPLRNSLKQIHTGALRASDLVKQILTFSSQDSGELKLMKMQPIIKEALKLIRSTIPTTIEIKQNLQSDCGAIKAAPTQIHQIVMNLATNASHAMEETGGELNIRLKKVELDKPDLFNPDIEPGAYACLSISDTGKGMDKELIEKIFDPFFTTKELGKGTGMGLSVVHGIVKNMNGTIKVDSRNNKGSEFQIYLPLAETVKEQYTTHVETSIQNGTEHILLVDDENIVATVVQQMLERLGYQVTVRTSSLEALEAFRTAPDKFDIVITDMQMPNMSGDKLASELNKIHPGIPVLLCTGFSETMSEEKAASLGINGFLLKPIVMKDLSHKIREVLDAN